MKQAEEAKGMPLLGENFPEMKVVTTQGEISLPKNMAGKWWVLFSHPADFTPVCTTEFVAFAKRQKEFDKVNTKLIGLSIDQVFSHIKWIEWIEEKIGVKINFPIIADDRGKVAEKLGMIHPSKGAHTVRAVFIVDPKGALRLMLYYPQEIGRNIDEILRIIKALQISDSQKVAMPANWPENELIGDQVIIPPAKDVKTANSRKKKKNSYDWWFVYKKANSKK